MTASWTPAERAAFEAKRKSRNLALGILLGALVVLFFGITVVRMVPALLDGNPATTAATPAAAVPAMPAPETAPASATQ